MLLVSNNTTMHRCSCNCSCISLYFAFVPVVGMLKTLAPDYHSTPLLFRVADNEGEPTSVGLGFRLNALSFFFFEFMVLRLIFMANTAKVLADDLTVFRFRRLLTMANPFVKAQFYGRTNGASPPEVSPRSWGSRQWLGDLKRSSSSSQLSSRLRS